MRGRLQNLKAASKISEQRAAQGLLCRILSVYKLKHPSILVIICYYQVCLTLHQRDIFSYLLKFICLHVIQRAWMRGEIMALDAKTVDPCRPALFCCSCLSTRLKIPVPLLSLAVTGFPLPSVWAFVHPGARQSFCYAQSWSIPASSPSPTSFILCHSCLWFSALSSEFPWVCVCVYPFSLFFVPLPPPLVSEHPPPLLLYLGAWRQALFLLLPAPVHLDTKTQVSFHIPVAETSRLHSNHARKTHATGRIWKKLLHQLASGSVREAAGIL